MIVAIIRMQPEHRNCSYACTDKTECPAPQKSMPSLVPVDFHPKKQVQASTSDGSVMTAPLWV